MHFPDQYYVGKLEGSSCGMGGKFPLGFATPEGKDSAAKKRKATVESWAGKNASYVTIDNVPTEGFRFVGDVTRSRDWFGSGASVWRVEDPRGFEIEITSGNLMMLMELTTIENGLIKGKCLYARDGAKNALLLENSEEYQAAFAQTTRMKSSDKFTLKSLLPGDLVTMVDGTEAQYFGKICCLVQTTDDLKLDKNGSRLQGYFGQKYVQHQLTKFVVKDRYLMISTANSIDLPSTPKIAELKKAFHGDHDYIMNWALDRVNQQQPSLSIAGDTYGAKVVYAAKAKFAESDATLIKTEVKNIFTREKIVLKNRRYDSTKNMYVEDLQDAESISKTSFKNKFVVMEKDGNFYLPQFINVYAISDDYNDRKVERHCLALSVKRSNCDTPGFFPVTVNGNTVNLKWDDAILSNKELPRTFQGSVQKYKTEPEKFFEELFEEVNKRKFYTFSLEIHGKTVPILKH
jgi:hypothetical protein